VAFERLYRSHSRRVFTLCVRMLENLAEAGDLTQETFLKVFRRIRTFRGESAFSTWLHRVTVNVVLMPIRKKRVAQTPLEEITERKEETRAHRLELGGLDLYLSSPLSDSLSIGLSMSCHAEPRRSLCFTTSKARNTAKLPIWPKLNECFKSQLHKSRLRLRELLQKDQKNGTPGKIHPANRVAFETVPPGNPVHRPPLQGNKIVPFKRKRERRQYVVSFTSAFVGRRYRRGSLPHQALCQPPGGRQSARLAGAWRQGVGDQ
jgi:RNA polymerase sigma-70 factor (ECF subfamily)